MKIIVEIGSSGIEQLMIYMYFIIVFINSYSHARAHVNGNHGIP